jgi:hypothetical protein
MNKQLRKRIETFEHEARNIWALLSNKDYHRYLQGNPQAQTAWLILCNELQARPNFPPPEEFTMLEALITFAEALKDKE